MKSKYPKINYIGNKLKLVDWILEKLPLKYGTVLDLFSGGNSVSYALKLSGYKVLSNDVLYSNYVISKAIIENSNVLLSDDVFKYEIVQDDIDKKYNQINFLTNRLYYEAEVKELSKLILISEKLAGYEKYLFLSLLRRAMIRKLPYSRMNVPWNQIIKLRDEDYSYNKYKRKRAYHNESFEHHIRENLKNYNEAIFNNNKENSSYNMDSFDMIKVLKEPVDIIYLDPPYPMTMNKYGEFYGLFDTMLNQEKQYINFSANNKFLENLEDLIKLCVNKTKYIVISQNTKTKPTIDELSHMLSKYGNVKIEKINYQYKVTNKTNKNTTEEVLIIVEINKKEK